MTPIDQSHRETPDQLRKIAYHEAGHAIAAFALGFLIERAVIDHLPSSEDESDGRTRHFVRWSDEAVTDDIALRHAEDRALVAFAGDAAEIYLIGARPEGEWNDHGRDYMVAMAAAWKFFPENRLRHAFLEKMEDRAHAFVREPLRWHQIQTLSAALLERHEMTGIEVVDLLNHAASTFAPPT
jgi:hypothetical protein